MSDLFSKNYFEIFNIPVAFDIDTDKLADDYRALLKEVHPDRFVNAGEQQSRLAMQMASLINQAFDTLKSPLLRAQYLLTLAGLDIDAEKDTSMNPAFLMEQMELRDTMEEAGTKADPLAELDKLSRQISAKQTAIIEAFQSHFAADEFDDAREVVRQMQFLNKNLKELDAMAAAIEDELLG